MIGTLLVLAGSIEQFERWRKEHGLAPKDVRYIYGDQALTWDRGCRYVLVGQYWLNPLWATAQTEASITMRYTLITPEELELFIRERGQK